MKNANLSSCLLILTLGLLLFLFSQWHPIPKSINHHSPATKNTITYTKKADEVPEKQKGAHVFGTIDSTNVQSLMQYNLEWVTMVSWGFQDDYDSPVVTHHDGDSMNIVSHNAHWHKQIEIVRATGYKVFFKPHLWIMEPADGKWRADIFPTSEENWVLWQKTYRDFILRYAKVAEEAKADMFCIGGEFSRLTVEKPDFWESLIREIRSVYSGKLTYAANWYQEYENITFWDDLDYIGIQAYFPLVKHEYPTVEQISKGWQQYFPALEAISKKYNRPILFTEMGYKSTPDSAIEPWQWIEQIDHKTYPISVETQANCYQAFFNTVWQQAWFAGVHIWQYRSDNVGDDRYNNLDFTPQGKPAERVIARGFE